MFFETIFRHKALTLSACLFAVLSTGYGLSYLKVSTDNRIFFGASNPYFQDQLRFEAEFSSNDNILFVVAAPYKVNQGRFPEAIRWLTDEVSALDYVIRVDSLATYPHPSSESGLLTVKPLLDWVCPQQSNCQTQVAPILSKPHLTNRLVNASLTATGILATVLVDRGSVGQIEALHRAATMLADRFQEEFPELEIHFTGGVPMMAAFASETSRDLGLLLPAALAMISILLALVLGSTRLALAIVAIGLASIATTLGIAGWVGHVLNNATSIIPLVVFTLVVTSSMHIAVHFSRNLRPGSNRTEATSQAKASIVSSSTPILMSAATSAVSLCSLWFVDSPPIRQLGLFSALGVTAGCALTVIVLPVLLSTIHKTSDNRLSLSLQASVNWYARRLERGKASVLLGSVVLGICIAGVTQIRVNEDFVKFFDESVPFRIQTDRATELLAGPNHIEVVVENSAGSVFDLDYLRYVEKLTENLRNRAIVANVHSFSDVMSDVSEAFSDQSIDQIKSTDELAQLFLVYELSLQQGQSNTDLINSAQTSSRVSILLTESTSSEIQELESSIYKWHAAQGTPFDIVVTGENIPVAHLSLMNIKAMSTGIFVSLAFTALGLGLVFRSTRLGLAALLATVVPVIAGFGVWGWINNDIGLAATAVIALTIGVVVDDAAHYIYRFLDARTRLELDPWAAAAYACHRAGAAIAGTSVVMGFGLALLMLSSFEVNSSFGAVACLIIAAALGFNLTILPRLTVWAAEPSSMAMESNL